MRTVKVSYDPEGRPTTCIWCHGSGLSFATGICSKCDGTGKVITHVKTEVIQEDVNHGKEHVGRDHCKPARTK